MTSTATIVAQRDLFEPARAPDVAYLPARFAYFPLDGLIQDVEPRQYSFTMYGKTMPRPRLERWFHTDPDRGYTFGGGRPVKPAGWHDAPLLNDLRILVQAVTGEVFDSCFVNVYRGGSDSIDWHADDEEWIGPVIASVSLGEPRKFLVRPKDNGPERYSWMLGRGDLLVMKAGMQDGWLHSVRKTAQHVGVRLNATFRQTRV